LFTLWDHSRTDSNESGTYFPFFPAARMYTMSLAQRVRDYRYSKGWGPDELASRAAISRTALYQIESGKTELPRAGTLRRIAMALEVSMDSLLGHGEASRQPQTASAATARRTRSGGEWIPAEGGPLTVLPSRAPAVEAADPARFGIEAQSTSEPPLAARERELAWKLHELLGSPLGEGIARIVEESHRLLPQMRASS
jgi:transcriptional regulator with XRE-family HTH domain